MGGIVVNGQAVIIFWYLFLLNDYLTNTFEDIWFFMQDCKISLLGLKIRLLGLCFQTYLFRLFFNMIYSRLYIYILISILDNFLKLKFSKSEVCYRY